MAQTIDTGIQNETVATESVEFELVCMKKKN